MNYQDQFLELLTALIVIVYFIFSRNSRVICYHLFPTSVRESHKTKAIMFLDGTIAYVLPYKFFEEQANNLKGVQIVLHPSHSELRIYNMLIIFAGDKGISLIKYL